MPPPIDPSQVRPQIALYQGRSPLSRVIRRWTRSDYSHAAWICPDATVIEAWATGGGGLLGGKVRHVDSISAQHTKGTAVDLLYLTADRDGTPLADVRPDLIQAITAALAAEIGKAYDYRAIFGFAAMRDYQNPRGWFCSELIAQKIAEVAAQDGSRTLHALLARVPACRIAPGHLNWSPHLAFATQVATR